MTLTEFLVRWKPDPVLFVRECFQVEPDKWQIEALQALGSKDPKDTRISLQACAGPGKTALLVWCGAYFLLCCGDDLDHPKGIAASCNWDNLRTNLWPEFSKWFGRSPILSSLFEITSERIFSREHPRTWLLDARGWAKGSDAEAQGRSLSGLHAKYVLVMLDETGDTSPAVGRTAEQALAGCTWGKIIQAGNPTSHSGLLYEAATKLRHEWRVISITGDPDDPNRSPRVPIEWARQQIKDHTRDNPWVQAYILGTFPPSGFNSLLSPDEVQAAIGRYIPPDQYVFAQKRIGVDVARFGDDATVLYPRQGLVAFDPVEMRGARTQDIAARVAVARQRFGAEIVFVDATGGYGAGVIDALGMARIRCVPVDFSGKAEDPQFFNKRTEIWWRMASWVKKGGSIPNDTTLARELTTPTYWHHNGKIRLEEKDQIKKRLGFSPDHADALAETFALVDQPAQASGLRQIGKRGVLVQEDPLEG